MAILQHIARWSKESRSATGLSLRFSDRDCSTFVVLAGGLVGFFVGSPGDGAPEVGVVGPIPACAASRSPRIAAFTTSTANLWRSSCEAAELVALSGAGVRLRVDAAGARAFVGFGAPGAKRMSFSWVTVAFEHSSRVRLLFILSAGFVVACFGGILVIGWYGAGSWGDEVDALSGGGLLKSQVTTRVAENWPLGIA